MDLDYIGTEINDFTGDDITVTPTSDEDTIQIRWGFGDENAIDLEKDEAKIILRLVESAHQLGMEDVKKLQNMD